MKASRVINIKVLKLVMRLLRSGRRRMVRMIAQSVSPRFRSRKAAITLSAKRVEHISAGSV